MHTRESKSYLYRFYRLTFAKTFTLKLCPRKILGRAHEEKTKFFDLRSCLGKPLSWIKIILHLLQNGFAYCQVCKIKRHIICVFPHSKSYAHAAFDWIKRRWVLKINPNTPLQIKIDNSTKLCRIRRFVTGPA